MCHYCGVCSFSSCRLSVRMPGASAAAATAAAVAGGPSGSAASGAAAVGSICVFRTRGALVDGESGAQVACTAIDCNNCNHRLDYLPLPGTGC